MIGVFSFLSSSSAYLLGVSRSSTARLAFADATDGFGEKVAEHDSSSSAASASRSSSASIAQSAADDGSAVTPVLMRAGDV